MHMEKDKSQRVSIKSDQNPRILLYVQTVMIMILFQMDLLI